MGVTPLSSQLEVFNLPCISNLQPSWLRPLLLWLPSRPPRPRSYMGTSPTLTKTSKKLISATEAYQGGLLSQAPIAIDFVPTHLATRKGFYDSLLLPSTVSESDAQAVVEHVNNTLAIDNPRAVETLISKQPQIEDVGDEGIIKAGIQLLLSDHLSFSDEVLKRTPADVLPQANEVVDVITVALRKGVDAFIG